MKYASDSTSVGQEVPYGVQVGALPLLSTNPRLGNVSILLAVVHCLLSRAPSALQVNGGVSKELFDSLEGVSAIELNVSLKMYPACVRTGLSTVDDVGDVSSMTG